MDTPIPSDSRGPRHKLRTKTVTHRVAEEAAVTREVHWMAVQSHPAVELYEISPLFWPKYVAFMHVGGADGVGGGTYVSFRVRFPRK